MVAPEFDGDFSSERFAHFALVTESVSVSWCFDQKHMYLRNLLLGKLRNEHDYCQVRYAEAMGWCYQDNADYDGLMARGLYCLGFEVENVLSQLNHPLSAHEKLELRLSLPREFWPENWLEEEKREASEARLARIWEPMHESAQRWEIAMKGFMRVIEIRERMEVMIAWDGIRLTEENEDYEIIGELNCDANSGKISFSHSDELACIAESCTFCDFAAQWTPLFRRNCWLSGLPVEASGHEKVEWLRGFTSEEIQSWDLKI